MRYSARSTILRHSRHGRTLIQQRPAMDAHSGRKPPILVGRRIPPHHLARSGIRLNPFAIAHVGEHVDPAVGDGEITRTQRFQIKLAELPCNAHRDRVAAETLTHRLRAKILPPQAGPLAPWLATHTFGEQGATHRQTRQSRTIDSPGRLTTPQVARPFELLHLGDITLTQTRWVHAPRQRKCQQADQRHGRQPPSPPQHHPGGHHETADGQDQQDPVHPAVNRIEPLVDEQTDRRSQSDGEKFPEHPDLLSGPPPTINDPQSAPSRTTSNTGHLHGKQLVLRHLLLEDGLCLLDQFGTLLREIVLLATVLDDVVNLPVLG